MKVGIAAIGRMRRTAEADLVDRYLQRAEKAGRALGITGFSLVEIDESRAGDADTRKRAEAEKLLAAFKQAGRRIALDETGKSLTSIAFSDVFERWRNEAGGDIAIMIGGPDGHGPQIRQSADLVLSLGSLTLPHLLARAVLCEQLYRAVTILTGHPYHRA